MDVKVLGAQNVAEDNLIVMRLGGLRGEAPLTKMRQRSLRMSVEDGCATHCSDEPLHVEVHRMVASSKVRLKPGLGSYCVQLDTAADNAAAGAGPMVLNVQVDASTGSRGGAGGYPPANGDRQPGFDDLLVSGLDLGLPVADPAGPVACGVGAKGVRAVAFGRPAVGNEPSPASQASQIKEYALAHGLLPLMQDLLRNVLREQPDDPYRYMVGKMQAMQLPSGMQPAPAAPAQNLPASVGIQPSAAPDEASTTLKSKQRPKSASVHGRRQSQPQQVKAVAGGAARLNAEEAAAGKMQASDAVTERGWQSRRDRERRRQANSESPVRSRPELSPEPAATGEPQRGVARSERPRSANPGSAGWRSRVEAKARRESQSRDVQNRLRKLLVAGCRSGKLRGVLTEAGAGDEAIEATPTTPVLDMSGAALSLSRALLEEEEDVPADAPEASISMAIPSTAPPLQPPPELAPSDSGGAAGMVGRAHLELLKERREAEQQIIDRLTSQRGDLQVDVKRLQANVEQLQSELKAAEASAIKATQVLELKAAEAQALELKAVQANMPNFDVVCAKCDMDSILEENANMKQRLQQMTEELNELKRLYTELDQEVQSRIRRKLMAKTAAAAV